MPADPRDFKLDLSPAAAASVEVPVPADTFKTAGRPWLSVRFDCCGAYQRVYLHRDGDRYEGRCPRCLRTVRFKVGPGGSPQRQFVAR